MHPARARPGDGPFLPDFCSARVTLAVVLLAQLVAILLALARYESIDRFWESLGRISLFLVWCTLLSAALLCWTRRLFTDQPPATTTAAAVAIVLLAVAAVSTGAWWLSGSSQDIAKLAGGQPGSLGGFLLTNLAIASIVSGLLLRYFWVTAQWRREVREEARSRVLALQARMRPHFLFNSMNTIAALTRRDPARAEEAVEDLADLLRASLADGAERVTLREELELTRTYERIEKYRLGDRLKVAWRLEELPEETRLPALSLQPLLENAIYHGIERFPGGGVVMVSGRCAGGVVELSVENPLPRAGVGGAPRNGHGIALDNLQQRFELAWGPRAAVEAGPVGDRYRVVLRFPAENAPGERGQ